MKSKKIILALILALGLFLRTYQLSHVPPGLTWDEAALGYNAYSISKTLKDEYGTILPLILKSFGDYKPALYAYLDIPFVMLFGLNEWAVRLPSVIAGIGLIIVCYLLVKEIFKNQNIALAAAFFAAISPLSIQFSRAGFESNVALFLNASGLYFFLIALKKPKFYIASAIFFSLSLFCYQASKLFIPILLIGLFLFFRKEIKLSKIFLISLVIMILSLVTIFVSTFLLGQSNRLAAQNFFAYKRTDAQIQIIPREDGLMPGSFEFEFLHGEWFAYVRGLAERYLIYFSPNILFVEGDYSARHNIPETGILPYYGLIFVPFGFFFLWKRNEPAKKIIFFYLFTASIPAVLSRDLISMVRALNLLLPIIILEAMGFYFLVNKLAGVSKIKPLLIGSGILAAVLINLGLYIDSYFIHAPIETSGDWLYGYKQVIAGSPGFNKYNRVVMTDAYGQPYIYYLFYTKYPPEKFQSQAVLEQKTVDVGTVRKIDNIEFRPISWPSDRGLENTLFIAAEIEIPDADIITEKKSNKLSEIDFLNGKTAFKIVENSSHE